MNRQHYRPALGAAMCLDCGKAEPAHGYDQCVTCFADFLLSNPAEATEYLRCLIASGDPLDEDDSAIVAILRADSSSEAAALDAGGSLPLAAGAAAEVLH